MKSYEQLEDEMGSLMGNDLYVLDSKPPHERTIMQGHFNDIVSMMLRVRDAALEEAAEIAEQKVSFPDGDVFRYPGGHGIAAAVRALKQENSK